MDKRTYDAVVVGSGPNGLAAAITLQQNGLSVLLLEAKDTVGGGLRSAALTLPGFLHDTCSAIHPMAVSSPFFKSLPLQLHGLKYIRPTLVAAHPFDDGSAAALSNSLEETAALLGDDQQAYLNLIAPVIKAWPLIDNDILAPLHFPKHPLLMGGFGLKAIRSAISLSEIFATKQAKGLWAGLAAHAAQPLTNLSTSAIGMVLMTVAHIEGWPIPEGGSESIADALAAYFIAIGGKIETGVYLRSLDQLPSAHAVLFDVAPKQLLQIAGHRFSSIYRWQLNRYRYGMGVFKMDWALDAPVPFTAAACRNAGTVHIGNTLEEIALSEAQAANGVIPQSPFVLFAQPSVFDQTRAPEGKHTAWAYCHVPNAAVTDMSDAIENQIERFAPGFKERILAKHTMNAAQLEDYNPNYIGGDINGGMMDITQLFTRPALRWSPYKSSAKGIYICSASTPPGGGVHGMCGFHAAKRALKEVFKLRINNPT